MRPARLEAFSDGVLAIIITIMVLEMHVPGSAELHALVELGPVVGGYALSFVVVGILWVNHHHLVHTLAEVDRALLWLNLHLLFWVSLIPFTTSYLGHHGLTSLAVSLYGADLTLSALAFHALRVACARRHAGHAALTETHARARRKNAVAISLYAAATGLAWLLPAAALAVLILVPALYFLPGRAPDHAHTSA